MPFLCMIRLSFFCKVKTKYRGCFKETLNQKAGPRRSRVCTPLNSLSSLPRAKMGTEAFCKGVKEVELSNSGGWRVMHWGPLSPDSHRPPGFQTRCCCCCCCGGANPARGGPRLRPLTLPDTRQKGRSNHGLKRVGEQEVSILQRRKILTRTPLRQPPGEAPGRPLEEGPEGAGVGHPHIRGPPRYPQHPAAPGLNKFTPGSGGRLPGHYLARPSQAAWGRTRTSRPARLAPLGGGGGGAAHTPEGLEALPLTADSPRVEP